MSTESTTLLRLAALMATDTHTNGGNKTQRHNSLWFSDGNIVLSAISSSSDNDIKVTLFRVHKSILSRQSQVFGDMFALPEDITAPDNNEAVEGLPLVRLHDPSEDIEDLLRYLYDPTHDVALARPRHPDFAVKCRGILKLANKYGMDEIKNHFIGRLRSDWPKTLGEWDYADVLGDAVLTLRETATVDTWPEEFLSEPVSAAILAFEYNVTDVLPAIFYEMSRRYASIDWDELAETKVKFSLVKRGARWNLASGRILHLRNVIREEVEQFFVDRTSCLFHMGGNERVNHVESRASDSCPNVVYGQTEANRLLIQVCKEILQSSRDWLKILRTPTLLRFRCETLELCLPCGQRLNRNALTLRRDLWRLFVEKFNPVEPEIVQ